MEYLIFCAVCNVSNIRHCHISPSAFHANSIPEKLCHKWNVTRGGKLTRKGSAITENDNLCHKLYKLFEKMYLLIIIRLWKDDKRGNFQPNLYKPGRTY